MFDENPNQFEPPHNYDAEEALLACAMIDPPQTLAECAQAGLMHEAFYRPAHGILFRVLLSMPPDGIDLITVYDKTRQMRLGEFADFKRSQDADTSISDYTGGIQLLNKITSRIESTANLQSWLGIVVDCWKKRKLLNVSQKAIQRILASSDTPDDVGAILVNEVASLSSQNRKTLQSSSETVPEAMQEIADMADKTIQTKGIKTGLIDVDRILEMGMREGEMTILAARPGMGKTSFALNVLESVAVGRGIPCLMFSLEMMNKQITRNMIQIRSGVCKSRIIDGIATPKEMEAVRQAAKEIAAAPIQFEEGVKEIGGILSVATSVAARFQREGTPLGFIIVDYLQLVNSAASIVREQQVSDVSRKLKGLAKSLRIPILVPAQLNREMEKTGRKPILADLRESGSIEQDADRVMFIYHNQEDQSDLVERIMIAKNRDGSLGEAKVIFNKPFFRFDNYTEDRY